MRKTSLFSLLIILLIWLTACTTSRTVVSNSANLEKYNYATITRIMDYSGAAQLMNIEVEIYDALSSTRLQVIGDKQINSLSDFQKNELLLVRFSALQSEDESVVSINFTDYSTGKPVASCRGAYGLGLSKRNDIKIATKRAIEQMRSLF